MGLRVGISTGGTFTNLIAIDEQTAEVYVTKVLPTPGDTVSAFINALQDANLDPRRLTEIVLGTTVGSTAVLDGRTAVVGLLCTKGFRDILETRRLWRERVFGNGWERPQALVPRRLRQEVPERLAADGQVIVPLDEAEAIRVIRQLKQDGVSSYAVCLLHAYRNPIHEQRLAQLIIAEHPGSTITLSSQVLPEIREYERTSTTVLDAMLKPVMLQYLSEVQERVLALAAASVPMWIMKGNGGLAPLRGALEQPVQTLFSGPAGGVSGALHIARLVGLRNVITLDMGETATDVSVIPDQAPLYIHERDLAWNVPVRTPLIDVGTIEAGGGSIAWIDSGGAIQVGSQPAGVQAGPACYQQGGTLPTVTDANLILNRIGAASFLDGRLPLSEARARQALEERLGAHFGWSAVETAHAICQLSLTTMALHIREIAVTHGYDPSQFTLMCYGGNGPLFAGELAVELGIPQVVIPVFAGVFSALGGLVADVTYDFVQGREGAVTDQDVAALNQVCTQLIAKAKEQSPEIDTTEPCYFALYLDLRYRGESYELTVPLQFAEQITVQHLHDAVRLFHDRHHHLYALDRRTEPVQMVAIRLRVVVHRAKPRLKPVGRNDGALAAIQGERDVYFLSIRSFVRTPVFARAALGAGSRLDGPAVIEDNGTTIIVCPGHKAKVDTYGNIVMEVL